MKFKWPDPNYFPISGHFDYSINGGKTKLAFVWDDARIGPGGSLLLIEEELTKPVSIHIHGHIARAAYMVAIGEPIRSLVWIIREEDFPQIWSICETWRAALLEKGLMSPPPCQYWMKNGRCLSVSPDFK